MIKQCEYITSKSLCKVAPEWIRCVRCCINCVNLKCDSRCTSYTQWFNQEQRLKGVMQEINK